MAYQFPLVEVRWDDAASLDHGWVDPGEEKPAPQIATTVGFLVTDTPDYVVIASTTDGTWVNGRFQIPRGMVKAIKPLRKKRASKGTSPQIT
jgi:hypothetical protein